MHHTLGKEAKFGSITMAVVVLCAKTLEDDKTIRSTNFTT